jgi:ceramide glucosyltransferase
MASGLTQPSTGPDHPPGHLFFATADVLFFWVTAALAALACAIQAWQFVAAWRFPLHQRIPSRGHHPAISLLKPIKGADPHLRKCLVSWLRQDYPGPVEFLFAIASLEDPACEIVRQLLSDHPGANARLVLCPGLAGPNAKVAKLAILAAQARYDLFVVSDADVLAPPDLLQQLAGPMADPTVGLVNCFYRLANPVTPALRCEAVSVNADFWSQVLQSRCLFEQRFALGAVMMMRREDLAAAGGFESLVHHLADDYQLGHRIHALGRRIVPCTVPVECWESPAGWGEVWQHQLRWTRTIRVCQPLPFLASIVSNVTLWALLHLTTALTLGRATWPVAAALASRAVLAHLLHVRMAPEASICRAPWWTWIKDLQATLLWAAAFLGNTVIWRGDRFRVSPDGRLTRL